ncbi:MAG: 3-phosphoglycerate dehydrogenase [Candidatus Cloacimonetes bacterium]|nr:3-phosphoglycerate dehydrogenase [Candidatus Cloacimonadota bacterium]
MKILVATEKPFAPAAVDSIREVFTEAGYELRLLEKYPSRDDLLAAVADVDALIVRSDKIDGGVMSAAPNLKIVVRAGAGYDNINLADATSHGIVVENTPGQNANAVAELVIGMMVYMARGKFNGKPGTELKGKKLGLHAYGNVPRNLARIAQGFGMEVFAADPFISAEDIEKDGVTSLDNYEAMYEMCDYVSLHLPLVDSTRRLINYRLLRTMKPGATLLNSARAEVVCEEGIKMMLAERPDFKFASDISSGISAELVERFPANVYFTPKKMGAQTKEANVNSGKAAATQIVGFFTEGDTTFKVN